MQSKVIFTDNKDPLLVTYLRDISKYKILDSSEINELIIEAQKGNDAARNKVVNSNLRFVVTIAKQFQHRGIPLMDLIEAGNLGLIYSVDKFNVDKGFTFLSYAVWWIKQFIYKSIYWNSKVVRLPMSQQLLVNSITSTIESFIKEHHRNPSPVEISELTNISLDQVDFLAQFSSKVVSVDDYIGGDEENNQIIDLIKSCSLTYQDTQLPIICDNLKLLIDFNPKDNKEPDELELSGGTIEISPEEIFDVYPLVPEIKIKIPKDDSLSIAEQLIVKAKMNVCIETDGEISIWGGNKQ